MKKVKKILLGLIAVTIMFTASSCYGTFSITKKIYNWNESVTDNKFANSIIMFALIVIPVYEICAFVDWVVINTIEFWTGSNPLSMTADESETQLVASGDKVYEITATMNQFHIEQIAGNGSGQIVDLKYKPDEAAWFLVQGNQEIKLAQGDTENAGWIKYFTPDGKVEEVCMK